MAPQWARRYARRDDYRRVALWGGFKSGSRSRRHCNLLRVPHCLNEHRGPDDLLGKAFALSASLDSLSPSPDHRKVEIRDIREERRGIADRHRKGHPFRSDTGRMGEFAGHHADDLSASVEDGASTVARIDRRIHLKDSLDASRPHRCNPTAGHGDFPEAERKSGGDDFLIESDGSGIADGRLRQPDRFNLEQGEVVFGIGADQNRRRAEFPGGHDENPFRIGDHMLRRQDIPIAMDDDPAPSRFRGQRVRPLGTPETAGAGNDHRRKTYCDSFHGRMGITTLIAPAFCPSLSPSRG